MESREVIDWQNFLRSTAEPEFYMAESEEVLLKLLEGKETQKYEQQNFEDP